MKEKVCFKCGKVKPLTEYYKHNAMSDGYLGKCKDCTKKDTKIRLEQKKNDKEWILKEKERHRLKYHRLNYRGKHNPTKENKKAIMDRYNEKYPEKKKARNMTSNLKCKIKGNNLHHWSYNDEHLKDVIEMSVINHNKLHRYTSYDNERLMYRVAIDVAYYKQGLLLDSRDVVLDFCKCLNIEVVE